MTPPAIRKRKQRNQWKATGKVQVEAWIPRESNEIITDFAKRLKLRKADVMGMILKRGAPLYLGQIDRILAPLLPARARIVEFELKGITPSEKVVPPVRIGDRFYDPCELHRLLQETADAVAKLRAYGLEISSVDRLFGRLDGAVRKDLLPKHHPKRMV
jgi:hypothetical protein